MAIAQIQRLNVCLDAPTPDASGYARTDAFWMPRRRRILFKAKDGGIAPKEVPCACLRTGSANRELTL